MRPIAWLVLVVAAVFQAIAHRHSMTPDGVAYLDLSDAFLRGDWHGFVNLYWSPLYPALLGVARLIAQPSAYWEFTTVHVVNIALFIASLAAFEWFLASVSAIAERWPDSPIHHRTMRIAAYVFFGAVSLTMTTLELPTPDLLVTTAALVVFGALLRAAAGIQPARNAAIVGLALGLGALAKSFFVPWGLVCLGTLAVATRRGGSRPVLAALLAWAAVIGPWCAVMTHRAGRPSFGETGRLTYVWYVNMQFSPTSGAIPPAASDAGPNAVLPGVGSTGNAPGTNPMWLDPARWYSGLTTHFGVREQFENLRVATNYYVRNLAPLLLLFVVCVSVASASELRQLWRRGWVVFVPVAAALIAYALVIVTARYVAGFLIAGTLMLAAALPWPNKVNAARAALGLFVVFLLETWATNAAPTLCVLVAGMAGVVVSCTATRLRVAVSILLGTIVAFVVLALLLPAPRAVLLSAAALVTLATWLVLRRDERQSSSVATRFGWAFGTLLLLLLVGRVVQRLWRDAGVAPRPNNSWLIAQDLARNGVGPGTRILLVGPADQATWARTARLRITADVPTARVPAFWSLPQSSRDSLLSSFAATGAQVAVASLVAPAPMEGWRVIESGGWVHPLSPTAAPEKRARAQRRN